MTGRPKRGDDLRAGGGMCDMDLCAYAHDDDALVRLVLSALDAFGALVLDDPVLLAACVPDGPLAVRSSAARIAREHPDHPRQVVRTLAEDPPRLRTGCRAQSGESARVTSAHDRLRHARCWPPNAPRQADSNA